MDTDKFIDELILDRVTLHDLLFTGRNLDFCRLRRFNIDADKMVFYAIKNFIIIDTGEVFHIDDLLSFVRENNNKFVVRRVSGLQNDS